MDDGPHVNPPNAPLRSSTIVAKESTVCDFKLPTDLLRQLENWERLNVNPDEVKVAEDIHYSVAGKMTGWLYLRPTEALNLVSCPVKILLMSHRTSCGSDNVCHKGLKSCNVACLLVGLNRPRASAQHKAKVL